MNPFHSFSMQKRKGIVRYIEYVSEIKNEPDYDAALKAVRELK